MYFDLDLASPQRTFDVILVGGGTIGLMLAVTLARRGKLVAVFESGGQQPEHQARELNKNIQAGRPHDGIDIGRARVLGGTSTLWGGQLTEFRPGDFEPRLGIEKGWPIGYSDVQPYYERVARDLGLGLPIDVKENVGAAENGEALSRFYTRWLPEPNMATFYRRDIQGAESLEVWLHACTAGFEYDDNVSGRISGLKICNSRGDEFIARATDFVLANGTIEISRLLLIGALDPRAPWADNPWLGRGFQDHLDIRVARVVIRDKDRFRERFENVFLNRRKYQPKLRRSAATSIVPDVACSLVFSSDVSEHMQYLKIFVRSVLGGGGLSRLAPAARNLRSIGLTWIPMILHYVKHRRIFASLTGAVFVNLHCEQRPLAESRIELDANCRDRLNLPAARLTWKIDGRLEYLAMRNFVDELSRYFEKNQLGSIEPEPWFEQQEATLDMARDSFHQCGGARMAADLTDGVVDSNCRVWGSVNLFVAGAATFRTSGYANPTFTALALAARLADHLSEK